MSVINQMLKDLDKRNPEQEKHVTPVGDMVTAHSTKKIIVLTSVTVFLVCFIVFYMWTLLNENSALKAEKSVRNGIQESTKLEASITKEDIKQPLIQAKTNKKSFDAEEMVESKPTAKNNEQYNSSSAKAVSHLVTPDTVKSTLAKSEFETKNIASQPLPTNANTQVTPQVKLEPMTDEHFHEGVKQSHSHTEKEVAKPKVKANKMSVSRRQLSPDELAKQKISLAEKALTANQISKAEKLLEEAVIIRPNDSQTRKKLAALWYGRKAYKNATNLLSQGIALNSQDYTLRELKARIHLTQGQTMAALNTLKPLANLDNEQYQVMLANTAQQAGQNDIAIKAYKKLISMQPNQGRWYLGLAVLYDKNSQFNLASSAYKNALTKNDLSISSESFIKQRIEVIGQ